MAEMKTKATGASAKAFIDGLADESVRRDCRALVKLMKEATGEAPRMWGPSMVGFGEYHYKYDSGREGDWFITGFSPRKSNLTLYIMAGFAQYDALLKQLGPHKTGKSCLYVKRLADVDAGVLRELVERSVAHMRKTYPAA